MGIMKNAMIDVQNNFEGIIRHALIIIEKHIDELIIDLKEAKTEYEIYVLTQSINYCYRTYEQMQVNFWYIIGDE